MRARSLLVTCLIAGCNGMVSGPGGDDVAKDPGAPAVLPRLTTEQYLNSTRDLLGSGLPAVVLEPDTNPYLFASIGATTTTLSEVGVQEYEGAAHILAGAVFGDPARRQALVGCAPLAPGDDCARAFLARFGRRALRRPLASEELDRWVAVSVDGAGGDPWRGLRIAVAGMLQSPYFIYRIELGEPDPAHEGRLRYSAWEMASRLSFLMWNTTPDDALLAAAESGELTTEAGVRAAAERLLADPRARVAVQSFFAQYLDLGRLRGASPDTTLNPTWTPTMAASMRREVELLVDDLVFGEEPADALTLFSTRTTFVNAELAALYGIDAPDATADTFVRAEMPADGPRAGLLTLGAFLAMNAHPAETAPTLRGKYLRERVLCELVPPPPQDFDIGIDDGSEEPRTMRERMEQHAGNPACAGCHTVIDPPGFLFEGFDEAGVFRTADHAGNPVDTAGDLDGIPLADARELAVHLATDPRVPACMVRQLFRHANGRLELEGEAGALDALTADFAAGGHQFRSLLVSLVASESFRTLSAPEVKP